MSSPLLALTLVGATFPADFVEPPASLSAPVLAADIEVLPSVWIGRDDAEASGQSSYEAVFDDDDGDDATASRRPDEAIAGPGRPPHEPVDPVVPSRRKAETSCRPLIYSLCTLLC
jgi:hypothetical protein